MVLFFLDEQTRVPIDNEVLHPAHFGITNGGKPSCQSFRKRVWEAFVARRKGHDVGFGEFWMNILPNSGELHPLGQSEPMNIAFEALMFCTLTKDRQIPFGKTIRKQCKRFNQAFKTLLRGEPAHANNTKTAVRSWPRRLRHEWRHIN